MNVRRLAGSRRNKHLPIARTSRPSDLHPIVRAWSAGRMSHDAAADALYAVTHKPWRKPYHAARAVGITAIWAALNLDDERNSTRRVAAEAGARGVTAKPMSRVRRLDAYEAQNMAAGRGIALTPRQVRQHKRMNRRNGL